MKHLICLRWVVGMWTVLAIVGGAGCGTTRLSSEPSPGTERDVEIAPNMKMTFCWVPATTSDAWKDISDGKDTFTMGSPIAEAGRGHDESPHEVRLTKGFWLGKYEVTQAQWEALIKKNPSSFKGPQYPVEQVGWNDCQAFLKKLNGPYRLPTEAEWEYACRSGTTGAYAGSLEEMGWYLSNSGNTTHPVGQKKPNAWGLFDMHGNVWEWCADGYGSYPSGLVENPFGPRSGGLHVLRGGSLSSQAPYCRSARRTWNDPNIRNYNYMGFRLIYDVPGPDEIR